jgi:hypothetical protein
VGTHLTRTFARGGVASPVGIFSTNIKLEEKCIHGKKNVSTKVPQFFWHGFADRDLAIILRRDTKAISVERLFYFVKDYSISNDHLTSFFFKDLKLERQRFVFSCQD